MRALRIIIVWGRRECEKFIIKKIKDSGRIFCQVERIMQFGQFREAITFGNQKWRGARPAFRKTADENMRR